MISTTSKKILAFAACLLGAVALQAQTAPEEPKTAWPPSLPGAVNGTVTVTSDEFLKVPEAVEAARSKEGAAPFIVAKTPPTVELAFHGNLPDRALNGTGWSSWGDVLVASDGKVYSGTGNHGSNIRQPDNGGGQAYVYCWDPTTKRLTQVADLNKIAGVTEDDPAWSKVHAGIHEDSVGRIYFTGTLNDGGRSFQTKWTERVPGGQLFRYDPKSGTTDIIAVFPGEATPTTLLDSKRGVWYANLEGKTAHSDAALTAVDVETGKVIYQSPRDAVVGDRNLAMGRDGTIYFNGKNGLWRYDPTTRTIRPTGSAFPGTSTMRASTLETREGAIYGITMRPGRLFRYLTKSNKLELLGPDFLTGDYTTVAVLSPDEEYVYYLPGAHGGAANIGTPVVQYEISTGQRKVLAFLKAGLEKATNYSAAGTYGVKISSDGATLYVGFNGNLTNDPEPPARQAKGFGLTAFAAIHIPASERSATP